MKKYLLISGIIVGLSAINSYADNQMVAVYTCTNGCDVITDKTSFNCVSADGKSCGNAVANIFVPQTPAPIGNTSLRAVETTQSTTARAARVARKPTAKPISSSNATGGVDKSMSGTVEITCPSGCSFKCVNWGNTNYCGCMNSDGDGECGEEKVVTLPNNR